MLTANLPVCQYVGTPGQNNSGNGGSNNSQGPGNNAISGNIGNTGGNNISGTNSSNTNNNGAATGTNSVGLVGGAAKNQLEQLNTMREALFAQDGWGCQHVNQETNWEVPSSPEPTNKDSSGGPPIWKPNVNNGTDLWESNLRNGGQPPTQTVQKTPWGHTPSSNLGGTWGEDDDGADSSSVWAGGSSSNSATQGVGAPGVNTPAGGPNSGQQWGQNSVNVGIVPGSTTAGNTVTLTAGGGVNSGSVSVPGGGSVPAGGAAGNGWGDPRSGPMGGPMDMRAVDPRDPMRAASAGDPRDLRMMDPRDPIRGDPRGISGRLNGNAELWGQHHPSITHNQMQAINKMVGPGGVGAAVNVAPAVGPSSAGGSISTASNVASGNASTQWGSPQTVVGPKDISSMAGNGNKQVTGWEEPSPPPQRRNMPNYDDGTSLWGGQQTRVPAGGGSHWKDISDPMNRNHLIRSTIGSQGAASAGVVGGLGPTGGSVIGSVQNVTPGNVGPTNTSNPMNVVTPQGRLGNNAVGPGIGHKPESSMWVHAGNANVNNRNTGSWGDDGNHNVGVGSNWVDDKPNAPGMVQIGGSGASVSTNSPWNDSPATWNKNKLGGGAVGSGGWSSSGGTNISNDSNDLNAEWNAAHTGMIVSKSQQKLNVGVGSINNDIIRGSKQYRALVEAGFKKEEVERALINANMNVEEAAEMLRAANATILMDNWRRQEENLSSYTDHANSSGGGGGSSSVFPGRYPTSATQPSMAFPPNNLINNMSASGVGTSVNNPNLTALNSMQPMQVQKYLNQGGPHNITGGPQSVTAAAVAFGQSATTVTATAVNAPANTSNQPSTQQLRMLVQQIQMAVHNGYLSNQILNQPLAPETLLLLNQLLSNIKHLQGAQQSVARGNNGNMQLNIAIGKYKQQIQNLQKQINARQAIYVNNQQHQALQHQQPPQQQHPVSAAHVGGAAAEYLRAHDAISALQTNFSDMNIKTSGYQGAPNQQSRLNQWKLPVLDKDITTDSTDFSRAPGATKQGLPAGTNVNSMSSLGLQGDGTWSTARNIGDCWPDSSTDNENKDWSVAQNTTAATTYTDLVQEFEPGKPWKGSQIKSIEDDPSITPGSVARSPLSINPTPKEADMYGNASKSSPTDLPPPLGLTSSTWSFNPSTNNQNFSSWSDSNQQCASSELWAASMNKTSRGPPPGLVGSNKNSGGSNVPGNSTNGWLAGSRVNVSSANNVGWNSGNNSNWISNWLLLKNLTTQIDSSTLRTLCMQHGPLLSFHLYLSQGIALCRYATREEANKAQMTLNNCVLGNTTIVAESPSENEVQAIIQHMPTPVQPVTSGGSGGNNSCPNASSNTSNSATTGGSNSGNNISNGSNNSSTNTVSTSASGGNSGQSGQTQSQNGNSTNNGGNNNTSNCANSTGGSNPNIANSNNAAAAWRQSSNQQQSQARSATGREADFDYISKYVCSIVDD